MVDHLNSNWIFGRPLITCPPYPVEMPINLRRESRCHSHFQTDDTLHPLQIFLFYSAAAKFRWRDVGRCDGELVRWQHANCEWRVASCKLQGGQRTNRVVVKLALNALINYWDVRCGNRAEVVPMSVDCCWMLVVRCCSAVVCAAFNAFRIYLWPLDARNSAIPRRSPSARCLMFGHVKCQAISPESQKGRKPCESVSENTKDENIPALRNIFIGHLAQIFHTFTKGQPHFCHLILSICDVCLYEWIVFSGITEYTKDIAVCSFACLLIWWLEQAAIWLTEGIAMTHISGGTLFWQRKSKEFSWKYIYFLCRKLKDTKLLRSSFNSWECVNLNRSIKGRFRLPILWWKTHLISPIGSIVTWLMPTWDIIYLCEPWPRPFWPWLNE